jgi:hypothetical protein
VDVEHEDIDALLVEQGIDQQLSQFQTFQMAPSLVANYGYCSGIGPYRLGARFEGPGTAEERRPLAHWPTDH